MLTADCAWTRRTLLKTSAAGVLCLAANLALPRLAFSRGQTLPEGELSFYNVHTDERLRVRYRDESGHYDLTALDDVNHILRCHHTGEVAAMDPRVIEHLNLVQKALGGGGEIHVISGYRSPQYNALLVKRTRRAAKHSFHVEGQAVDFFIPGFRVREIRQAALKLRFGGVGYYPRAGFIHLDCGPFRFW
ncbi:MAG TPA: DUF882 domain-containing protein [Nitrospira sp.]|nr:DUF882 domain-containing protein [Nitrospira sp.]